MKFNSTEQPLIWFRDRYSAGELVIKPPYQRKPVWAMKQKCFLIESILLGLPVPEVYIQHIVETAGGEEKSKYYVVDGQQRIRTVLQFIGADLDESEQEFNKFALEKLPETSTFRNITYATLSDTQRQAFLQFRFAVRSLELADEDAVRDMFRRLNRYLTKLNDQELRNATFTGPFTQAALRLADSNFWLGSGLVSPGQVRRMKDVEFVSELLIGVLHGPQGGSAKIIDDYYHRFEDFDEEFPGQKLALRRFDETMNTVREMSPADEDSRFRSNRTDFYTLFVATAFLLRDHELPKSKRSAARAALTSFETAVNARMANSTKKAPARVVNYVDAVEKGANEKARRAERHLAIIEVLQAEFKARPK